jgi:hypothetical protein
MVFGIAWAGQRPALPGEHSVGNSFVAACARRADAHGASLRGAAAGLWVGGARLGVALGGCGEFDFVQLAISR